jgi:hypothetical protein
MQDIIENYINKLTKEDIIKYAKSNNLTVSNKEIDFIYTFIKTNYKSILNNPNNFNISNYQDKFSKENYLFINNLINKYRKLLK